MQIGGGFHGERPTQFSFCSSGIILLRVDARQQAMRAGILGIER